MPPNSNSRSECVKINSFALFHYWQHVRISRHFFSPFTLSCFSSLILKPKAITTTYIMNFHNIKVKVLGCVFVKLMASQLIKENESRCVKWWQPKRLLNFVHIVVPLSFQHKVNYFSFIQKFEILFLICVEIFIKSKFSLSRFEIPYIHCQGYNIGVVQTHLTIPQH